MKTALIVVDVQNDFCPKGALAVPNGDRIVPEINMLFELFPYAVLTQDWHPPRHCSFASTYQKAPYSIDDSVFPGAVLWPDHCVAGSPGADFHPDLEHKNAAMILRKGSRPNLDSYSAFFENDGLTSTGLFGWLSALEIPRIAVVGLATDYCVKATALDARRLGLEVIIIPEAVKSVDVCAGDGKKALDEMESKGCRLLSIETVRQKGRML